MVIFNIGLKNKGNSEFGLGARFPLARGIKPLTEGGIKIKKICSETMKI